MAWWRHPDLRACIVLLLCGLCLSAVFLEFGFFSIDEESYAYLTRNIVQDGQLHFNSDYTQTRSRMHLVHLTVPYKNRLYSAFAPGYAFLATPFYALFGIRGMQLANLFFGLCLLLVYYRFVRHFFTPAQGVCSALLMFYATPQFSYSLSLFSHTSATLFLMLSLSCLIRGQLGWAGLSFGLGLTIRYTSIVTLPVLLGYGVFRYRREIWRFFATLGIGLLPLLLYNSVCFGRPWRSGMTLFNAQEQYQVFSLWQWPQRFVTQVFHYTFFPQLEQYANKGALLETAPWLFFASWGAFLWWQEQDKRPLLLMLSGSVLAFLCFLSGVWSLGGVASNMRLLTEILPCLACLASIPLFRLSAVENRVAGLAGLVGFIAVLLLPSYPFMCSSHFLIIAFLSLWCLARPIRGLSLFPVQVQQGLLSVMLWTLLGSSLGQGFYITRREAKQRKVCRQVAQRFEQSTPKGSVVFIPGTHAASYTDKRFIFLDYTYVPQDIPKLLRFYRARHKAIKMFFVHERQREALERKLGIPLGHEPEYRTNMED